jgi:transcription elongation GreA/GreB family factor
MNTLDQARELSARITLKAELVERAAVFDALVKDGGMTLAQVAAAVGLGSHEAVRSQIVKYGPGSPAALLWRKRQRAAARAAKAAAK